ncbi:hypothetical protein [Streptomyces sp. NPDC005859]
MATSDPAGLPEKAIWYLATNLPHPDAPRAATGPHPPADLAEIVRLYGLRPWIEQSFKAAEIDVLAADVLGLEAPAEETASGEGAEGNGERRRSVNESAG